MKEASRLLRLCGFSCTSLTLAYLLASTSVMAYPHRGERVTLNQPDGSTVEVVLWGDEYFARAETPEGYALVLDPNTKWIDYATTTPEGDLLSTGAHYEGANFRVSPEARGIELERRGVQKGARPSRDRVRARMQAAQRELWTASAPPWEATAMVRELVGSDPEYLPAPVTGGINGLVVLVDFSDRPGTISLTEVENAFNASTYGDSRGSIKSWSETISYGKASVSHKVVGYMRAAYPTTHYQYGTDYAASTELMKEVFAWIDANVDLSPYAVNGSMPSLAVIYAGAIISNGWATSLWPHSGCGRYTTSEGVSIRQCYMSNLGTRTPISMGTHRHELGHAIFQWPDTYDYDDDSQSGGGYAQEEGLPCAPFRLWAGWVTAIDINDKKQVYELPANGDVCLRYVNPNDAQEYFIIEYMKKEGWRTTAPDEGLLVWHIDDNRNRGNNSWQDMTPTRHYRLSVEQADGLFHLEKNSRDRVGDLFHAGDKTRFDETTTPNSNWWSGSPSGMKLCDISGLNPTMTVNVGCGTGSGTGGGSGASTGGATSGGTGAGGAARGGASSGGTSAGGSLARGGTTARGGATAAGGRSVGGAGAGATGGRNTGGAALVASGGRNTGGTINTAGRASGGLPNGDGGLVATGGNSRSSGGASGIGAIGGSTASGAAAGNSAIALSGGASTTAPIASNAGATTPVTPGYGGVPPITAAGGSAGALGDIPTSDGDDAGGCSCRVTKTGEHSGLAWLAAAAGLLLRKRSRARLSAR